MRLTVKGVGGSVLQHSSVAHTTTPNPNPNPNPSTPESELLYLAIRGVSAELQVDATKVKAQLRVQHMQLDNQSNQGGFPVVLAPHLVSSEPTITLEVCKVHHD